MDVDIVSWLDELESTRPVKAAKSTPTRTLTSEVSTGTTFEIDRDVLLHLLEKAIGVVPSRDIVPVLTNFQLVVKENELKVIASSLELSIAVTTDQVNTKVSGVEVFPARTFLNIVREAGSGTNIYVEVTELGAVIVAGGFSIEIKLSNGSDFPKMEAINDVEFYSVDRLNFVNAISTVKYALPSRDFGGMASMKMINIKQGKFTACDGSRFQQVRIQNFNLNMQLPAWSIGNLIKTISTHDQEILEIGETANKLIFKLDNCLIYLNKLEDAYPNVEQLWLRPALNNDLALTVDKQQLLTAIKQVKLAADTDSNAIALILTNDSMEIRAKAINSAAKVVIDCQWSGKDRAVVVNYIHLAEMLKVYNQSNCKFLLGEDTAQSKFPLLLKDDDTYAIATVPQMLSYRAGLTS